MSNVSIFLATHLLFFTSSVIASLLFYLWSRPSRVEVLATLAGGIGFSWYFGLFGQPYTKVMVFLAYWGAWALAFSFVIPFFTSRQVKKRVSTLEMMVAPPLLEILGAVLLGLLNRYVPHTLDYYLYAFDFSLGYPPGFLGSQLLSRFGFLRVLAEASYINLTLAMSIGYLLLRRRSEEEGRRFLGFLVILGLVGFSFYIVFPAAGTEVIFPGIRDAPKLASVAVDQTPNPGEPRNCIPSLHTAWALALLWRCPKGRWLYAVTAIYTALTLLYTLSCGHYLADMVAAVPFTLAAYAISRAGNRMCRMVAAISVAVFLCWLLLLRYATNLFLLTPALPWALIVATVVGCYVLRRMVDRSVAEAAPSRVAGDFVYGFGGTGT